MERYISLSIAADCYYLYAYGLPGYTILPCGLNGCYPSAFLILLGDEKKNCGLKLKSCQKLHNGYA